MEADLIDCGLKALAIVDNAARNDGSIVASDKERGDPDPKPRRQPVIAIRNDSDGVDEGLGPSPNLFMGAGTDDRYFGAPLPLCKLDQIRA